MMQTTPSYEPTSTEARKPAPQRVLVFGASGVIGAAAATALRTQAPQVQVRLATSRARKAERLRASHPDCEVVQADYLELPSLLTAFDGVDGVFVVTPDFMDETRAMSNVVAAAFAANRPIHIVRLTGDPPGVHSEDAIPDSLRAFGGGTAVQHLRARRILETSGLPVTYLNIAAYFMADFAKLFGVGIARQRTLFVPYDRVMAYLDGRDAGEAAAALLLSTNARHLGKTYHLDNGVDLMRFADAAQVMSEALGVSIRYDDSPEHFIQACAQMPVYRGREDALRYAMRYFEWERESETLWRRTDVLQMLLGRPGRTLRAWFEEHRSLLLGDTPSTP